MWFIGAHSGVTLSNSLPSMVFTVPQRKTPSLDKSGFQISPLPILRLVSMPENVTQTAGVSSPTTELPQGHLAMPRVSLILLSTLPTILRCGHYFTLYLLLYLPPTPFRKLPHQLHSGKMGLAKNVPDSFHSCTYPLNPTGSDTCSHHFSYPVKVALLWTVGHHPCYTCAACSFLLGDVTALMIPVVRPSARLPPVCRSVHVSCLGRAFLQPFSHFHPLTTAFPSVFRCWELHAMFHFPYNHSLFSLDSKASAPLPPGSSSCQGH